MNNVNYEGEAHERSPEGQHAICNIIPSFVEAQGGARATSCLLSRGGALAMVERDSGVRIKWAIISGQGLFLGFLGEREARLARGWQRQWTLFFC